MELSYFITSLDLHIPTHQRWVIVGSQAEFICRKFQTAHFQDSLSPASDGLLLVEALSTRPDPLIWLAQTLAPLKNGAAVILIDWQADGPLDIGPGLKQRVKQGVLRRWLRKNGYGQVKSLIPQNTVYYAVQAIKGPVPVPEQAGQFVEIAHLDELPRNGMKAVELFGHPMIVANTGREIVAFARPCPHAEGDLTQGRLRGRNILCPLHYYIWNVQTGMPVDPDDEDILPRYPVKVESETGRILVAIADDPDG